MKTILLWNPRVPVLAPVRLALPDSVASALVRCGVAAAADPADQGALEAGGAMTWDNLIEVAIESGPLKAIQRVAMPDAAVAVAASLGIAGVVEGAMPGGGGDIAAPVNISLPTIAGSPGEGDTIAATMTFGNGAWSGVIDSYSSRILLAGAQVSAGYIWQTGDAGKVLTYEVTAHGPQHSSAPATSDPLTISYAASPIYNEGAALIGETTDGATITINYGDWDADTLLITLEVDGTTVGTPWSIANGDAAPTFNYSYAAMVGRHLRAKIIGTKTASGLTKTIYTPVRVGMFNPVAFTANFTGAVDAPVADENGWIIAGDAGGISYAKAAYVKSPAGHLQAKYAPGSRYLARVASANSGFEVVWPFVSTATTVYRDYYVLMSDYQNYVQITMRYDRVLIDQRVAGVQTTVPGVTNVLGPWGADAVLRSQIKNSGGNKYIQVFVNDVEITSGVNGGLGFGPINAALTSGTMVGVGGGGGDSGDHWVLCKSFKTITPQADDIDVSVSAAVAADSPGDQTVTASGTYVGAVNDLEYLAADTNGNLLRDWTPLTSESAGAFSEALTFTWGEGGTGRLWVRDPDMPATAASADFTFNTLPPISPLVMGVNLGSFQTGQVTRNLMQTFAVSGMAGVYAEPGDATSAGSTGFALNAIGFPTRIPSGAYVELGRDYLWPGDPASDVFGTYVFEFHPDLIWSIAAGGGALTEVSRDQAGGTATVTVNSAVAGSGAIPLIRITAFPTDPNNCYLRAYKQGSTTADKAMVLRPQASSYYGNFASLRNMDLKGTNRPSGLAPIPAGKLALDDLFSVRTKRAGPGLMLKLARQTGAQAWDCLHDMMTGAAIRAYAQYLKDNLLPGETYVIERSNECWNSAGGFNQTQHNYRSAQNFTTGATYALAEGDYIKGATSGRIVQIAAQKVLTGTVAGGNATGYYLVASDCAPLGNIAWNKLFNDGEALHHCDAEGTVLHANVMIQSAAQSTQNISYARWVKWMIDQFETVWGGPLDPATSPVKFVANWQAVAADAEHQALLDEQNLYQKVSYLALAPYGLNAGDYLDTVSMSQANRDKALSDPAGFNTALEASIRAKAITAAASFRNKAVWLAGYAAGKSLTRGRLSLATYECAPQHNIEVNTPWLQFTGGNCSYAAAIDGNGNIKGQGVYVLKGKTSGASARIGSDGGGNGSNKQSGTFAGGNAAGWLTKGNQFTGTFQAGEVCDLYLWDTGPVSGYAKVQDSVLTISTINDIQTATRNLWAAFWRSGAFGAIYKDYLDGITAYGGLHNIFTGHGEPATARWNFGDWGYWNISAYVEDQAQQPYKAIQEWRAANA